VAGGDRGGADRLLAGLVAEWGDVEEDLVRLGRRCPRCGSDQHGEVVVVHPRTPKLFASIARSPGIAVAVVTASGAVGVDVERVESTGFVGFAAVALHPEERDGPVGDRAALWTRKEAVLKAVGLGVGWGPERLLVGPSTRQQGRVEGLPHGPGSVTWRALQLEPGYAAAVAITGDEPPLVRVRRVTLAGESR
jgi:4'-phosphopantetheinyl transferase